MKHLHTLENRKRSPPAESEHTGNFRVEVGCFK